MRTKFVDANFGADQTGRRTMQSETTYSGILGEVQRFQTAAEASVGQVPHLQASHARLGELLGRAQDLAKEQAATIAAKQELSLQLKAAVGDVQMVATMLRKGIKQHYGIRSEKLTEFGLQPFRGRKRKTDPAQPPSSPETPPAPHAV